MAQFDIRITFRTTAENKAILQAWADDVGHNNVSRVVRELIEGHCLTRRHTHKAHRGQKGRRR